MVVLLLFFGAFITSGWAQGGQDSTAGIVAEMKGNTITREELQSAAAEELAAVEMQSLQFQAQQEREQHRILENRLKAMLAEKLVDLEGSQQGLSTEELLDKEVRSKFEEPTQEEVEAFYEANEQQMNGPRVQMLPVIRRHLADLSREADYQAYIDQLTTKARRRHLSRAAQSGHRHHRTPFPRSCRCPGDDCGVLRLRVPLLLGAVGHHQRHPAKLR